MGKKSPGKWQYVPIKELYRGLYDGPHATPAPSDSGPIFLGIKNIAEDGSIDLSDIRHIAEEDFPKWTKRVTPQPGDIVFSYEATLHRYALIPSGFRGCLGRRMALIRVNPDRCDYKFLYFYLRSSMWRQVIESKQVIGATVDRIPLIKFPDFPILAPEVGTQKQIASILSAYDDLIENNKRRIAILEKMAEEIYREWFVRMRFPASAKAKAGKPSFVKKSGIQDGWRKVLLPEIAHITFGYPFKSERFNSDEIGMPIIRIRNIPSSSTNEYTDEVVDDRYIIRTGDFLVGMDGEFHMNHWIGPDAYLVQRTCRVKAKDMRLDAYLAMALRAPIKHFEATIVGATVGHLGAMHLNKIEILMPPESEIEKLGVFSELQSLRTQLSRINNNLKFTRDLLLPRLISGKLSVEDLALS